MVKPLPYEINIDESRDIIEALVNEPADPKCPTFGKYEEEKKMIELSIKIPQVINRGKKRVAKLKTTKGPLMITEGKGKDEDEPKDVDEEAKKEVELVRKKGKVIITKPPKPTIAILTRRSMKKGAKDESEVAFYRPPPTFEERLK